MDGLIGVAVQLLIFVGPLFICGFVIGRTVERRHFRNLDEREAASRAQGVLVTQVKSFPNATGGGPPPRLMLSEVVIGSDSLKSFLSAWRNIFGGELRSFQTLQERAKREAILRLTDQAVQQGYNAVCNVRVSAADVGGNTSGQKNKIPMAAVIASGTAYCADTPAA